MLLGGVPVVSHIRFRNQLQGSSMNSKEEVRSTGDSCLGSRTTLLFFGDSIANGLGVRGMSYIDSVKKSPCTRVVDYTHSGWTVRESRSAFAEHPTVGQVAIIAHGITEPILRPVATDLRWLPPRWRRLGWMDPRPYYSTRYKRRALERSESELRWRAKNLLITRRGAMQLLSLDEFVGELSGFVQDLLEVGCESVYWLEPTHIDPRYFPGSDGQQRLYHEAAKQVVGLSGVIATREHLRPWDDYFFDHFHPNRFGHDKIAALLKATLCLV